MPKHYGNRTDSSQSAIALRDYQQSLIQGVYEQWTQHQRVMAQLPTGGGKTVIFAAIAEEFVRRGESVLVLAHREELITQAAHKLETVTRSPIGIIQGLFFTSHKLWVSVF